MNEDLIVATITEALDTIADLKARIEAYERIAGLEATRVYGAPTKYIAYLKIKQNTSVEEVLELVKQKLERDDAVQERTRADTQDGYYYAYGKEQVSKTHWHKAVEIQKQIQDLEAYIEERIKAYISIEQFVASTALESILQRIRGGK